MIANNSKSVSQITNVSSSTLYNLTVHIPEVPPFNHFIPFTINIDTKPATTTPPSPAIDDTLIYVVVPVVIVLGTAWVVLTILCLKRRQTVFTNTEKGKCCTGYCAVLQFC